MDDLGCNKRPGLQQKKSGQQLKRGDSAPLLCIGDL